GKPHTDAEEGILGAGRFFDERGVELLFVHEIVAKLELLDVSLTRSLVHYFGRLLSRHGRIVPLLYCSALPPVLVQTQIVPGFRAPTDGRWARKRGHFFHLRRRRGRLVPTADRSLDVPERAPGEFGRM